MSSPSGGSRMLRRGWLLVVGIPFVLAACSGGGGSTNAALDLGPSPTTAAPSPLAAAPSTPAHGAPTPTPTHSAAPTQSAAARTATHTASPAPRARQTSRPPTHKATPSPTRKPPSAYTIRAYDYYFSPQNPSVAVGQPVKVVNAGSS